MESDESLWQDSGGDADAFGALFDRHAKHVYNHCFRRVANWSRAEDLTSIAFLEGWRSRARLVFVNESALPWLLGVATNVSRNNMRSFNRYRDLVNRLPRTDVYDDQFERVNDRLAAEKQMADVLERLQHLTDDELDAVALCGWEGLDYETTAQSLNIPVGTVKSRLARGRKRLAIQEPEASGAHINVERQVTLRRLEES